MAYSGNQHSAFLTADDIEDIFGETNKSQMTNKSYSTNKSLMHESVFDKSLTFAEESIDKIGKVANFIGKTYRKVMPYVEVASMLLAAPSLPQLNPATERYYLQNIIKMSKYLTVLSDDTAYGDLVNDLNKRC